MQPCCGRVRHVFIIAFAIAAYCEDPVTAQSVRPPPKEEWDKATADIVSGNSASQDMAVIKVRNWIAGGWVSQDLWRKWLPALLNSRKYDDVAELALAGLLGRPNEGMVPLMDFRVQALLAENRANDALSAAKSYYNVCDIKMTARAVDLAGLALAKAHPEDLEIVRRFRIEQATASAMTQPGAQRVDSAPLATLSSVKIDDSIFKDAIGKFEFRTKFADKVSYGNLLLAADKTREAEQVFRELFQLASSQAELAIATEGIAKSLRAQDGNVGRANTWLLTFQQHAATQPALPSSAAPVKSKDPSMP